MSHKDTRVKNSHKVLETKVTLAQSSRNEDRELWGQSKPETKVNFLCPFMCLSVKSVSGTVDLFSSRLPHLFSV